MSQKSLALKMLYFIHNELFMTRAESTEPAVLSYLSPRCLDSLAIYLLSIFLYFKNSSGKETFALSNSKSARVLGWLVQVKLKLALFYHLLTVCPGACHLNILSL